MNKQIIIDGVDVSGCGELYNGCCCDNGSFYCKEQPNCQFKLEKRGYKIEQITEFTPRKELIETITHLRVLNAELESYNEQLKESQNIEIKENKILREELKRKEQECEELKKRLDCKCFDPKSHNNRCISYNRIAEDYERDLKQLDQLKAENDELRKSNCKFKNYCTCDIEKFLQILIEIKKTAEKIDDECEYSCFASCAKKAKEQILQKISEVEDV